MGPNRPFMPILLALPKRPPIYVAKVCYASMQCAKEFSELKRNEPFRRTLHLLVLKTSEPEGTLQGGSAKFAPSR